MILVLRNKLNGCRYRKGVFFSTPPLGVNFFLRGTLQNTAHATLQFTVMKKKYYGWRRQSVIKYRIKLGNIVPLVRKRETLVKQAECLLNIQKHLFLGNKICFCFGCKRKRGSQTFRETISATMFLLLRGYEANIYGWLGSAGLDLLYHNLNH